jgi:hypothetical protein
MHEQLVDPRPETALFRSRIVKFTPCPQIQFGSTVHLSCGHIKATGGGNGMYFPPLKVGDTFVCGLCRVELTNPSRPEGFERNKLAD